MDLVEIRKKAKSKKSSSGAKTRKSSPEKKGAKASSGKGSKTAPKKKTRARKTTVKQPPAEVVVQQKSTEEDISSTTRDAASPEIPGQSDVPSVVQSEAGGADMEERKRSLPEIKDVGTLDDILMSQRRGPESEDVEESLQLLTLMVGEEEYGLNIMDIKEIIRPQEITEVPRTPDYVLGIISLRGVIIPVFDIRMRLGLDHGERGRKARIVVVNLEDNLYGLLVDSVVQVLNLPISRIEPPPEIIGGVDADFMKGVGKIEERLVILLDLGSVLTTSDNAASSSDG